MAALGLASLPVGGMGSPYGGGQQMQPMGMQTQQQPQQSAPQAAPTPLDATAITIKLATLAGERFKEVFYTVFDAHRTDLHRFFVPHSMLVWEGTPVQGGQCQSLFEMLPSSKHVVQTFDVQPVSGGGPMSGSVNTLLVTVTGTVAWGMAGRDGAEPPSGFFHTFVLERSQAPGPTGKHVHHVISSSMRTRFIEDRNASSQAAMKKKRATYSGR